MKKLVFLIIVAISIVILPSCGGSDKTRKVGVVQGEDTGTRDELSGDWNEADLRDSAKVIINQMLSERWYANALKAKGANPDVKIGMVKNKTDNPDIEMGIFTNSMQRVLINSGKVNFVMENQDQNMLRTEQNNQAIHASDDTVSEAGNETGADFMIIGEFMSMSDRLGGKEVKYLQINLRLINIESGKIVWIGEHKIKKFVQQKSRTW